ncbi:hypothetical protein DICSQDRAFT_71036 [Dichomitus squalens LYAD-421 SS1]|uniref:Phosphatidylglycerol/phosphatidylinositol transfer protein n=1 Tax=Dichomitus squalens (strain LYAD-421) TaxID=732165 RepID=R7SKL3_DICSQ|nr:uncharacterized protein DICSQDRAFT_71036 [Dichomitus squalens LYAD-421 SS1]EJF56659.1 hypothetical protein DICSQDRAFT_71036 [Dichomitus squalens LYAD-421 SS1]
MRNSLLVLASFVAAVAAQGVKIVAPAANTTLTLGETFVIDVERPDSLTGSRDVSVAIGLLSCVDRAPSGTCDDIDSAWMMGDILYAGPYHPVAPVGTNEYENFTVTVPGDFQLGPAVLAVAHFALVGELFWPYLEVLNETIFIEN